MKTRYTISMLALAGLLSSCSTVMYISNTVNTPLLKEKGEVKIVGDENDFQAAVAVTNHIGVMANGFSKIYQGKDYYKHDGRLGELGLGYFKAFKNNVVFETYAGAGIGLVRKRNAYVSEDNMQHFQSFTAQGTRAFFQPGIGYCGRFFEAAFTPRFSYVKYTHFKSVGYSEEELAMDNVDHNKVLNDYYAFAEPAITLRAGYRFVKLQVQYGRTIDIGPQDIRHPADFGNIGIVIDIAKWYNHSDKHE